MIVREKSVREKCCQGNDCLGNVAIPFGSRTLFWNTSSIFQKKDKFSNFTSFAEKRKSSWFIFEVEKSIEYLYWRLSFAIFDRFPRILFSHSRILFSCSVPGFLGPLESAARGNFGLTDQVAALHWIQENIASFGGDANNVTIAGHGSGAALVHLLMLSPMSKGEFLMAPLIQLFA